MVQYKRKPVKLDPLPPFLDDSTEIWVIEATDEVYTDYEKYLTRRDFYTQKSFTCEATGHTGYTFFEALESEVNAPPRTGPPSQSLIVDQTEASKEINTILPDGLRARVLEFVQFKNTARMDDLVNLVFDHFREHFLTGDRVSVEHDNVRRYGVITQIQDTSNLHHMFTGQPTDDQFRSFTYHITLDDSGEQVTKYRANEMQRDRRVYSKLVLKQFLRSGVSREAWNGAPWTIKEHLAKRYSIGTKVPEAKTRESIMAAKKALNAAMTNSATPPVQPQDLPNGMNGQSNGQRRSSAPQQHPPQGPPQQFVNFQANPPHYQHPQFRPEHPPPPHMVQPPFNDPHRPPHIQPSNQMQGRMQPPSAGPMAPPVYLHSHLPPNLPPHLQQHLAQNLPPPGSGLPLSLPFQNNFMQYQTLAPTNNLPPGPTIPLSRPFEPIKYPIEDLRMKAPRISVVRPPLKFLSDDVPEGVEEPEEKSGILMKSVGPILTAWETLNVHDTIYQLDSFTLDDFVDALGFSSDEVECELLVEMHCGILKQIVNDSGKLQVSLPRIEDSDDEDDEESSKESTPEPEPEPEPRRSTRNSLRKSEANAIVKPKTPTPEPEKQPHKAAEFLAEFNWIEQLKIRNFRDGGWQAILVGLLYTLSFDPKQKDACDEVLDELVPPEDEPTPDSIAQRYNELDVNLRVSALDMALRLTIATEAFRDQLVAASTEMTRLRKEKIEYQKKRKELADELFKLDTERKIHLPANMPASPNDIKENIDVSMTGTENGKEETPEPSEEEETPTAANRRLRHTKQHKRKREAEAAKKEKAKKAKIEAAKTKQQQEWEKLLASIEKKKDELRECEAQINELDDDLRETLVHRSRMIGKDRFLNKYYWFEHNGMPYAGVPDSCTAEYGYANGRLWVQGPDEYELQPNLEEPALSQDLQEFGFTIPQRKEKEEGDTHLNKSSEWGYYDDPEDLEKLVAWLDERGVREKALRKELQLFKGRIAEYMLKMKAHLKEEEEVKTNGEENATRVSTRMKTYVDKDATKDRCLLWTNSIVRRDYGWSHSEEYEPPRKGRKGTAKVTKGKGRK